MTELSMFLYPWDAVHDGIPETIDRLRTAGVNRAVVAVAYHSAEVVTPRRDGPLVTNVEANRAHLPLCEAAFSGPRLAMSRFAKEHAAWPAELAARAEEAGIGLTAWVVALHNSSLAEEVPDAALVDCSGGRSTHGLCPASPLVRTYVRELVGAVAAAAPFDRVLLESASYLLAGHGHPHELRAVRLDPRTRLLLSLCFCSHCCARASELGIDGRALRARCRERLAQTWNAPLADRRAPDDGLELAELLVSDPDLTAFARLRMEIVNELLMEVAAELHGVELSVASAVWGRPTPANWMEGIDLARTATIAAEVAVTTYAPALAEVARDLDHVLERVPPAQVMQLVTLWRDQHSGLDDLLAKVQAGRDAGLDAFGLYNLAMAPEPVRMWTRAVAELVGTA